MKSYTVPLSCMRWTDLPITKWYNVQNASLSLLEFTEWLSRIVTDHCHILISVVWDFLRYNFKSKSMYWTDLPIHKRSMSRMHLQHLSFYCRVKELVKNIPYSRVYVHKEFCYLNNAAFVEQIWKLTSDTKFTIPLDHPRLWFGVKK